MKKGLKTFVDILIGMVLGVILFIGSIALTIYLLMTSVTVGQIQDYAGFQVFQPDNTAGVYDMTLWELANSLIDTFKDFGNISLNDIEEKYGIDIPDEIAGFDITGIKDVPIVEIPDNFRKIFDNFTLRDASEKFDLTLPDLKIFNDNLDTPIFDALQNVMDEVDNLDNKTFGQIDRDFGLNIYSGADTNKTLLALRNTKISELSNALDNLYISDVIDINRDLFILHGDNKIYRRVDEYREIDEGLLETFTGDKYERIVDGEGNVSYEFSFEGTYEYVEFEESAEIVPGEEYFVPAYVNNVKVESADGGGFEVTVKQSGYISLSNIFIDIPAYPSVLSQGLVGGFLNIPANLVIGAGEPIEYTELAGYIVDADTVALKGSLEPAEGAEPDYLRAHIGTSDMTLQLVADIQIKNGGELADTIKDAKLYNLIDIISEDVMREAVPGVDPESSWLVKWGTIYVPYDAAEPSHADPAVKYVIDKEKSPMVLISLRNSTINEMSGAINTMKLEEITEVYAEDLYRPRTAADTDPARWFVFDGDKYVKYDASNPAHADPEPKFILMREKSPRVLVSLRNSTLKTLSADMNELKLKEVIDIATDTYERATWANLVSGKQVYTMDAEGEYVLATPAELAAASMYLDEGVYYARTGIDPDYADFYTRTAKGDSHVVLKRMANLKINNISAGITDIIDNLMISDLVDINEFAKVYENMAGNPDYVEYVLVSPYEHDSRFVFIKNASGRYYEATERYVLATEDQIAAGVDLFVKGVRASLSDPLDPLSPKELEVAYYPYNLADPDIDKFQNYFIATAEERAAYDAGTLTPLYIWNQATSSFEVFAGIAADEPANLYVYTYRIYHYETGDFYTDETGVGQRYIKKYANDIMLNVTLDLENAALFVDNAGTIELYDELNPAHNGLSQLVFAVRTGDDFEAYNPSVHPAPLSDYDAYVVYIYDAVEGQYLNFDASNPAYLSLSTFVKVRGYLVAAANGDDGKTVYMKEADDMSEKVLVSFKHANATVKNLNDALKIMTLGELVVVEPDTILDISAVQSAKLSTVSDDLKQCMSDATLGQILVWGGYATMNPVVKYLVADVKVSKFMEAIKPEFHMPPATFTVTFSFRMELIAETMNYTLWFDGGGILPDAMYRVIANSAA